MYGTENWGPAESRGNAVKDLAALNKVEVLPWDEWGRMTASYEGRTGAEYDRLIDPAAITALYQSADLAVPGRSRALTPRCTHAPTSSVSCRVVTA